jgi:hypothetical protein
MALFWSIAANGPKLLNFDGDLPRHLLLGRLIRETGSVPLTDTFSFRTEGVPSIPHEWLAQVIFSIASDLLGLSGVILLTAVLVTVVWAIVFHQAQQRAKALFVSFLITTLGIGAMMIHVLPRPHLFTYLFTALWILILEQINTRRTQVWWLLPVLMLLWVNLHGMFVLGIILWGIYLVGSFLENPSRTWFQDPATRSTIIGGALSILATFFSPSGLHIWAAITSLGSNSYITSRIPEYQSPNFHTPETWTFILLLLVTIVGFARSRIRIPWTQILLTASFAAIALYTSRMIPLFAIVVVPIAAKTVSDWIRDEYPDNRFSISERNISTINSSSNGILWILVLMLGVGMLFASGKAIDPGNRGNIFSASFFPVDAVTWLNAHPQAGHMFNEFDWGGYLLLKLTPRQQIFMDGHTHIYGEALTREYESVVTLGDGWQEILDRYDVQWAIVRADSSVARALENDGWEIIYQDNTAWVLHKP